MVGKPYCPVHMEDREAEAAPDYSGRVRRCAYCEKEHPSPGGAFFQYRPDKPYDLYYCGCRGWN